MSRALLVVVMAATFGIGGAAHAQEVGASRVQVGVATGGGALFLAATDDVSRFGAYAVGATVTVNLNPRFGIEGDFGLAAGPRQDVTIDGVTLADQPTPKILNYNGSLIYNPKGSDHRLVPFLAAGLGGLTMSHAPDTEVLGLTTTRSFLTVNTGGGVNWYASRHLGIRGDYRFIVIRNPDDGPLILGHGPTRFAHRIYGALVIN